MSNTSYMQSLVDLLAQERLSVVYDSSVSTACINLENRVIYVNSVIRQFDNQLASERLLCHEVGHALYTTDIYKSLAKKYGIPVVNTFEDIRIENQLKKQFPGIGRLFSEGFVELNKCLVGISQDNSINQITEKSQFIDKLNVYFKSNLMHPVKFSSKEEHFVNKLKNFLNSEDLEPVILEFLKLESENTHTNTEEDIQESKSNKNTTSVSDVEEDTEETTSSLTSDNNEELNGLNKVENNTAINKDDSTESTKASDVLEDFSEILEKLEDSDTNKLIKLMESLAAKDNSSPIEISLLEEKLPAIVSIEEFYKRMSEYDNHFKIACKNIISSADKSADILSVEFERRKNAKNFRTQHNRSSGKLDLNKLFNYKTSDYIFKNQLVKFNEKNHELVILLDWSTSIRGVLVDLIKECIILVKFCKRANITCRVYTFTGNRYFRNENTSLVWVEVLSTNSLTFDKDLDNLLMLGFNITNNVYMKNYRFKLYNTPLHESLFKIPAVLKQVTSRNKKVSLITITDGESSTFKTPSQFFDPHTKSLVKLNDYDDMEPYLYKRLKVLFPELTTLTIHIGHSVSGCMSSGSLKLFVNNNEDYKAISNKIQAQGFVKLANDYLTHLIIKVNSATPYEYNPRSNKITRKEVQKLLQGEVNTIAKLIYKELAAIIA